ncbi:hypothetical protein GmarT_29700 [Gimesia maris]|uniref:Fumarate hydratase n=1 Tax=Gimesia maris TaxID=122 RepID=A0ABX5YNB9_9PLAN|nr:hypothetical protein GmarT_29700 [Gimesia maris]
MALFDEVCRVVGDAEIGNGLKGGHGFFKRPHF